MRLSNRNKAPVYNFVNTVLIMILIFGIIGFFLERYKFHILGWESSLLIIVPALFLIMFHLAGRQIFEYDSDGEALNFKNRNILQFIRKSVNDEFPKYKLLKYEVVSFFIIKRLYITISSKKNNSNILKYDISFLSNKEVNDLKFSLNKVVKANKEKDNNSRI